MSKFADYIEPVQDIGGAVSFPIGYAPEEAGQIFTYGVPVMINSSDGGLQIWDGATVSNGIAGIACENANNLATTGAGAPVGFSPVLGPGSVVGNYSPNATQPYAVITPSLVPMSDGFIRFYIGGPVTRFVAKVGTSATDTPVATAYNQVGQKYGLSNDANGFWYVDTNKTGGSAVLQVTGLDPRDAVGTVGGHLIFTFLPAALQINA